MTSIKEFTTELIKSLHSMDSTIHAEEQSTTKTNGVSLRGILMYRHSKALAPIVYVDDLYSQFIDGKTIVQIAQELITLMNDNEEHPPFDMRGFEIYDNVRGLLRLEIVNYEWNSTLLEDRPHVKILDLACQYYIDLGSCARCIVSNSLLKVWKVTPETVYNDAYTNTRNQMQFQIVPLEELMYKLKEQGMLEDGDVDIDELSVECNPMFVLTNAQKNYGACGFIYLDNLKVVADQHQSDLIILPSSTHEVILIPDIGLPRNFLELKGMVREINHTLIDPRERLSDNIYFYHRDTNTLRVI